MDIARQVMMSVFINVIMDGGLRRHLVRAAPYGSVIMVPGTIHMPIVARVVIRMSRGIIVVVTLFVFLVHILQVSAVIRIIGEIIGDTHFLIGDTHFSAKKSAVPDLINCPPVLFFNLQ